jgi:hydroxyethylthiazole kinase-like sugar kinase family protein
VLPIVISGKSCAETAICGTILAIEKPSGFEALIYSAVAFHE